MSYVSDVSTLPLVEVVNLEIRSRGGGVMSSPGGDRNGKNVVFLILELV